MKTVIQLSYRITRGRTFVSVKNEGSDAVIIPDNNGPPIDSFKYAGNDGDVIPYNSRSYG